MSGNGVYDERAEGVMARDDPHGDRLVLSTSVGPIPWHKAPPAPTFLPGRVVRVARGRYEGQIGTVRNVHMEQAFMKWQAVVRFRSSRTGYHTVDDADLEPGPVVVGDRWIAGQFFAHAGVLATHVRLHQGDEQVELAEPVLIASGGWYTLDAAARTIARVA